MMFYVGQQVVCINGEWDSVLCGDHPPPALAPQFGRVYVITEVEFAHQRDWFALSGFDTLDRWDARWFRPAVEKKTDISIFTAILNNVPLHEGEKV